jgi:hypothetical protein
VRFATEINTVLCTLKALNEERIILGEEPILPKELPKGWEDRQRKVNFEEGSNTYSTMPHK